MYLCLEDSDRNPIFAEITNHNMNMSKFDLMALGYAPEALEPVIRKETIGFHHGKHLAGYVNNLNGLLPGSGFEDATLEEIVCKATGGLLNNAGQILNHNLYFGQFGAPQANNAPTGQLAEAITRDFGSFEAFKEEFQKKGATLFGSMPTIWIIRTVVLTTSPRFGRLSIGKSLRKD